MSEPTLSQDTLRGYIECVVYKPGWELAVYETPAQGIWLRIKAKVEDSYHPGEQVVLQIESPIPPVHSAAQFFEWLRWRLERVEVHECHEWLRDVETGRPLYDPHDEKAWKPV